MTDPKKKNETASEDEQEDQPGVTIESKKIESAEELREYLDFMLDVGEPLR